MTTPYNPPRRILPPPDAEAFPSYDVREIMCDGGQAQLILDGAAYTLRITRAGKLILTKRVTIFFILAAGANELVWRTDSEAFWVVFEIIAMPVIVVAFFIAQIGLIVEYASLKLSKRKK